MSCYNAFEIQMADCAPTTLEDTMDRIERSLNKTIKYISEAEYVPLVVVTFDLPDRVRALGKFFKIVVQRLKLFYSQAGVEVSVKPPSVATNRGEMYYWINNSLHMLRHVLEQLCAHKLKWNQSALEEFNSFLLLVIIKLEKLFQKTIWKEFM